MLKGAATIFFSGGGGFMSTQTHISQQFSFSSGFGHFIFKMLENAKFNHSQEKNLLKYPNFWGDAPADFSAGGRVPRPHAFGA